MVRVTKFRGYVKSVDDIGAGVPHKGHFVYGDLVQGEKNDDYDYIVGGMIEATDEYSTLKWWQPISKGIAEQSTGLKDKNDNEIYEGDVLSWYASGLNKHDWTGEVKYIGAGFKVRSSSKGYESSEWLDCASSKGSSIVEVISNVHQTPELVGGRKMNEEKINYWQAREDLSIWIDELVGTPNPSEEDIKEFKRLVSRFLGAWEANK